MIEKRILTVSDVNRHIKAMLDFDPEMSHVMVEGEISNFTRAASGHMYFSLKDAGGRISCVMFRRDTFSLGFRPAEGMKVVIEGNVSVFEREGKYQLYARKMRKQGLGNLYEEYLKLKKELELKGYFDEADKKEIPRFIDTVAVVTSPTGAAVRDVIKVIRSRNRTIKIIVCPVMVQGEGSAEQIASMIYTVNRLKLADVIITGRGGGSIEELWAFNERVVAEAVHDSDIPVISAVGHQTDYTICDFVADLRVATPSVAGESVSEPVENTLYMIDSLAGRIQTSMNGLLDGYQRRLETVMNKPVMKRPTGYIENNMQYVDTLKASIDRVFSSKVRLLENKTESMKKLIDTLSYESVLSRGFAIVHRDSEIMTGTEKINEGDEIRVTMQDGSILAQVTEVE